MIIPMARIRILGPRDDLESTIRAVQDSGVLHVSEVAKQPGVTPVRLDVNRERRRRQLKRILDDVTIALAGDLEPFANRPDSTPAAYEFALWARLANRERRATEAWRNHQRSLEDEQALIARYRDFLEAVQPLVRRTALSTRLASRVVVIPASLRGTLDTLAGLLRQEVGNDFIMDTRALTGGDMAVLLVLPRDYSDRLDARLAEARVPEVTLPDAYRHLPLDQAIPRMIARLQEIPGLLSQGRRAHQDRLVSSRAPLRLARQAINDWFTEIAAYEMCALTPHAFCMEGWIPERSLSVLRLQLAKSAGPATVVETLSREAWSAEDAPVVLSNPRFFRPFESIIALMPLPRYGSIDPTPYVAVFFPMFFGLMLGDLGYGLLLALLALMVHHYSQPGSVWRTLAEIAGPCAAFAIIFGALFGEFFGDAAERLFGVHYALFDRTHALVATLAVTIGLGVVHVVLGLVLGAINRVHDAPRHAAGKGISAIMVLLVVAALLAAFEVLPERFFTPAIVALLIAFPALIATEGLIAPLELLATLGNVLSYTRIMAIGTASVMLAIIANEMVGMLGSTVVGLVFALLFHLVNFAIGIFTPSIHALRLHYVEFFGKFYSPGGRRYSPLGHWKPSTEH